MRQWTPSGRAARFVANCVLRGYRSGQILISKPDEIACVDACVSRFLSPNLRRKVGKMWQEHGGALVQNARKADPASYSDSTDNVTEEILRALCA